MATAVQIKDYADRQSTHSGEKIQSCKKRFEELKHDSERVMFDAHCEDVAKYIAPRRRGFVSKHPAGSKRMQYIVDSTGLLANDTLAASMHGTLTNPTSRWFRVKMADDALNKIRSVQLWLSEVTRIMRAAMYSPGANFTPTQHENYQDSGAFGIGVKYIGHQQLGTKGLLFQARSIANSYIAENVDNKIDELHWETSYTVKQIMERAELSKWTPSQKVRDLAEKEKLNDKVPVVHATYRRPKRDKSSRRDVNMTFASCYYELETCQLLHESGTPEFPFIVSRWSKAAEEVYTQSPGMTALPDVKMLQQGEKTLMRAAMKAADPTWFLPNESFTRRPINAPGAQNFYRGSKDGIMQLSPDIRGIPITEDKQEGVRNRIRNAFHADTLQMVEQREMTLGEARIRQYERMRLMAPVTGRMESEDLGPMITRVMGLCYRAGLFPPIPEEIQGKPFVAEYVSPLATAQRQEEAGGIVQVLQYLSLLGPELSQEIIKQHINGQFLVAYLWDMFENEPGILYNEDQLAANEQAAKQQQSLAAAEPMANAADKGAGALNKLADAHASGGIDMSKLMGAITKAQGKGGPLAELAQAA